VKKAEDKKKKRKKKTRYKTQMGGDSKQMEWNGDQWEIIGVNGIIEMNDKCAMN